MRLREKEWKLAESLLQKTSYTHDEFEMFRKEFDSSFREEFKAPVPPPKVIERIAERVVLIVPFGL